MKPLDIPEWKYDNISMEFFIGLSSTPKGNDGIWVVID